MQLDASMYNTYFEIGKLSLWGVKKGTDFSPRLAYIFRDGNPRIQINTGTKGEQINFPLDVTSFKVAIKEMKRHTLAEKATQIEFPGWGMYEKGNKLDQKKVVNKLIFGITKEGIVYIAVTEPDMPNIAFSFKKSDWVDFINVNKEMRSEESLSREYALAYLELMENQLDLAIHQYANDAYIHGDYKPYEIKKDGQVKTNNASGYGEAKQKTKSYSFDAFDEDAPL